MITWYDGITLDPPLDHACSDMVAAMEKRFDALGPLHPRSLTRLRFGAELAKRELSMRPRRDAILTGAA